MDNKNIQEFIRAVDKAYKTGLCKVLRGQYFKYDNNANLCCCAITASILEEGKRLPEGQIFNTAKKKFGLSEQLLQGVMSGFDGVTPLPESSYFSKHEAGYKIGCDLRIKHPMVV